MRRLGDLALGDLLERVGSLALTVECVHQMHRCGGLPFDSLILVGYVVNSEMQMGDYGVRLIGGSRDVEDCAWIGLEAWRSGGANLKVSRHQEIFFKILQKFRSRVSIESLSIKLEEWGILVMFPLLSAHPRKVNYIFHLTRS